MSLGRDPKTTNSEVSIRRIAVIGAGLLGRRLAELCSLRGYSIILEDVLPSKLRGAARQFERTGSTPASPARFSVEYAMTVDEAVRDADLVIDCVPDELESKLEIFSLIDRMAPPRTIIASPTRALSIADLASCTYRPDRCFGLQLPEEFLGEGVLPFPNVLQITRTPVTDQATLGSLVGFWESLGFEATVVLDSSTFQGTTSALST